MTPWGRAGLISAYGTAVLVGFLAFPDTGIAPVWIAACQVAFGVLIGRSWALLLPCVAAATYLVLTLVSGECSPRCSDVVLVLAALTLLATLLVGVGIAVRALARRSLAAYSHGHQEERSRGMPARDWSWPTRAGRPTRIALSAAPDTRQPGAPPLWARQGSLVLVAVAMLAFVIGVTADTWPASLIGLGVAVAAGAAVASGALGAWLDRRHTRH